MTVSSRRESDVYTDSQSFCCSIPCHPKLADRNSNIGCRAAAVDLVRPRNTISPSYTRAGIVAGRLHHAESLECVPVDIGQVVEKAGAIQRVVELCDWAPIVETIARADQFDCNA